jgi:L-threonylcarbamoyladenylate synthase
MIRLRVADGERAAVEAAVAVLRAGGVVAYPTDTLYGLAVDPRQDAAVEKLFLMKGRDLTAAIPVIAASLEQARMAGELRSRELRVARAFWPGPLSLVVPAASALSRRVLAGGTTVALRVPAHRVARALAASFGFCITSTSANLSGQPGSPDPDDIARELSGLIDCLVDAGPAPGGPPSTIVDLRDATPALVRAGATAWDRVLRSLE